MKPVLKLSSFAIAASAALISGCGAGETNYGPYPHSATATPGSATPTPASTGTLTPSPTLKPGSTATPTPLPTATPTPLPSAVATFPTFPTSTPTPAPTLAPGQSPTPVPTLAPGATATPTPKATATAAPTPTLAPGQTPTPTPTVAAVYHPASNGDTFSFSGTEVVTYSRPDNYPTPEPTTTADYTIAQSVTVTNPATFGAVANAVDFSTSETDTETTGPSTSPIQDVIDNYYAFSGTEFTGDFYALGFTSIDSNNYAVVQSYASPGNLADILPETSGASWTNVATQQINTQNSAGDTSQQNYAANGTYTEELNFPSVGIGAGGTPMPAPSSNIVENIDGSGTYAAERNGDARTGDTQYTFAAPSGSSIAISILTQPLTSASPGATPAATSTTAPDWIPAGYLGTNLYTESDVDNGSKTIPASCGVPAAFGTTANQIVQTRNRVDTVLGEFETYAFTYYDLISVGPVCTVLHDVTTNYYDYTGQTYPGYFAGVPLQVTTIDETLGLTAEQLYDAARHPEMRGRLARAFAMRSGTLASRVAVFQARRRLTLTRNIQSKIVRHNRNVRTQRGSSR